MTGASPRSRRSSASDDTASLAAMPWPTTPDDELLDLIDREVERQFAPYPA
jgi:hypothetical protein